MNDTRLILGDCLEALKTLESGSVDSLVTDPPAGIGFMGKEWDSFGATRKANGQTARDTYRASDPSRPGIHIQGGSGLTRKNRDLFITFLSAVMAECLRVLKPGAYGLVWALPRTSHWTATALEDAGFEIRDRIAHIFGSGFPKAKSCLKPAVEDWWLVRKPGKMQPLQIDECRVGASKSVPASVSRASPGHSLEGSVDGSLRHESGKEDGHNPNLGRWPANLILDEEMGRMLDEQSGTSSSTLRLNKEEAQRKNREQYRMGPGKKDAIRTFGDTGGASRFFYCAKASKPDRGEGNTHPTVKNTKLMEWLVKLITPPAGLALDPFMGSGTTGLACLQTGRRFIGIELSPEYFAIAQKRLAPPPLLAGAEGA